MLARIEECPTAATAKIEPSLSGMDLDLCPISITRKNKNKKSKRFSDEQIKLLEFMFESETRPELCTKQQLANKLGLQPRQVAIWFQNRRARLKSKQIEQEYRILKASYDTLASRFESLKKENQSLISQLQALRNLVGKTQGSKNRGLEQTKNSSNGEYKKGNTKAESNEKNSILPDCDDHKIDMPSADVNSQNLECFHEETDILNTLESTDGFLTSSGTWCSFESSFLIDQSCCSSQWWRF